MNINEARGPLDARLWRTRAAPALPGFAFDRQSRYRQSRNLSAKRILAQFSQGEREREKNGVCVGWGLRRGVDRTRICVWECMSESLVEQKMKRPAITSIVTCLHANLTLEWVLQSVNPFVILLLNHQRLMLPSYSLLSLLYRLCLANSLAQARFQNLHRQHFKALPTWKLIQKVGALIMLSAKIPRFSPALSSITCIFWEGNFRKQ